MEKQSTSCTITTAQTLWTKRSLAHRSSKNTNGVRAIHSPIRSGIVVHLPKAIGSQTEGHTKNHQRTGLSSNWHATINTRRGTHGSQRNVTGTSNMGKEGRKIRGANYRKTSHPEEGQLSKVMAITKKKTHDKPSQRQRSRQQNTL